MVVPCTNVSAPRRGFTLIELLVVIAIVALLVGILLPTLGRARDSARGIVELSRLRDLGFATTFYTEANDGLLPISSHSANVGFSWFKNGFPWPQALYAFFAEELFDPLDPPSDSAWAAVVNEHYRSPLDRSADVEPGEFQPTRIARLSFGQNAYADLIEGFELPGAAPTGTKQPVRPYRATRRIAFPTSTVLQASLLVETLTDMSDHHMAHQWKDEMIAVEPGDSVDAERHGGGMGALFMDGHAEVLRFEGTFDLEAEVDRWDPDGF
ncbi:MAG: type II secretion system protein [Planctomycetota bacterium]